MVIRIPAIAALAVMMVTAGAAAQDPGQREEPRLKLYPIPIISYTPETRLMLGAALAGVVTARDTPGTRPTSFIGAAIYTVRRQFSLSVAVDRWTTGNLWHLTGEAAFSRFPADYYGYGATTTDTSETYTPETIGVTFSARRRLSRSLYAGPSYAFRRVVMAETVSGGRLAPGTVPGSRGGRAALLGLEVVMDTRSSLYGPRGGHYVRVHGSAGGRLVGSEFAGRRYGFDARAYRALGGSAVLAAQGVVTAVGGTVPFDLLPQLGGQMILRGFEEPRYRDRAMGAVQAELRVPIRGRVGMVLFGGAGTVAQSPGRLADGAMRPAGGAGLRILLDPASGLQLRVDQAVARGGGGLYIGGGDAF